MKDFRFQMADARCRLKFLSGICYLISIICLSVVILYLSSSVCLAQEQRINLAIAEFEARNVSNMDALAVTDFIRTELVRAKRFKVLDRNNMAMVLEEQKFQLSGCTTQDCAIKMGKILNVQKMVIGNLTKLAEVYFITASIIDIETGEIVLSERIKAPTAGELADASEELGRVLASGLTGEEVKISPKLYIPAKGAYKPAYPEEKRPYITEVIDPKKAKINLGFYDGVKKRNLYNIHKGAIKIGKLKITSVEAEESTGEVIKLKSGEKLERGLPILYKKDKWRAGGIGASVGPASGKDFDTGGGGWLFYDCIFPSGWGFQLNLGSYMGQVEIENYDNDTGKRENWKTEVIYSYPVIFKRHMGWHNPVSPYIGIGFCNATYNYEYSYYPSMWAGSDPGSVTDDKTETVPLFNWGIDILATKTVHFIIDMKFFGGEEEWYGYDTSLQSTSVGLSINW